MLAAAGGTKSSYDDKWQVIGVENGKLKLISQKEVSRILSGYNDSNANGSTAFEKAVDSYRKIIKTLNDSAKTNTGISTARSITLEDIEKIVSIPKSTNYGKKYTYTDGTFIDEKEDKVIASNENKVTVEYTFVSYTLSSSQKEKLGDLCLDEYWIATRSVWCNSDYARYGLLSMDNRGIILGNTCFYSGWEECDNNRRKSVRAVVYI